MVGLQPAVKGTQQSIPIELVILPIPFELVILSAAKDLPLRK